jgi:hypothetical protein
LFVVLTPLALLCGFQELDHPDQPLIEIIDLRLQTPHVRFAESPVFLRLLKAGHRQRTIFAEYEQEHEYDQERG